MKVSQSSEITHQQSEEMHFKGDIWASVLVDEWQKGGPKLMWCHWDPGSRTDWHRHPDWQVLHVTSGRGVVQVEGQEPVRLAPGDVVYAEKDEMHWHGSAPDSPMVYLSIMQGETEFPGGKKQVGDPEYRAAFATNAVKQPASR